MERKSAEKTYEQGEAGSTRLAVSTAATALRNPAVSEAEAFSAVQPVSLRYIFLTFLKLGATAFGGYMSLVAMVQKQVVEIDKKLRAEELLDGVSLTSVLPGPVAVNVIVYVGYRLRGAAGAAAAFAGIILPSFLLVGVLSGLYFTYGDVPAVKTLFKGITPVITALILTVAVGMARKTMKKAAQWVIAGIAAMLLALVGGVALTFGLIGASAGAGYYLFRSAAAVSSLPPSSSLSASAVSLPSPSSSASALPSSPVSPLSAQPASLGKPRQNRYSRIFWGVAGSILLMLLVWLLWEGQRASAPLGVRLFSVFAGCSVTLFGGGYVVIPALHELFVEHLHWLSATEFADGIAVGQVTPGPIFITATFIGYKVAGWGGAALATLAMFSPPAVLTVLASRFLAWIEGSAGLAAAMKGVRAAVIGLIFASAFTIGQTMDRSGAAIPLFLLSLVVSWKYAISPVYLIVGGGVAGLILF